MNKRKIRERIEKKKEKIEEREREETSKYNLASTNAKPTNR